MKFKLTFLLLMSTVLFSCKKEEEPSMESAPKLVATDVDGNKYNTLALFGEIWFKENLNVSHFKNGDEIFHAQNTQDWEQSNINHTPAWCWYDANASKGDEYGKIYNMYAIRDARGLAPESWHIATIEDWEGLRDALGGQQIAGKELKNDTGWGFNNLCSGTNSVLFTALPGGYRDFDGSFIGEGSVAHWWSSSQWNQGQGYFSLSIPCYDSSASVFPGYNDKPGYYVRCVAD